MDGELGEKALLSVIGMSRRAGKAVMGTEMVCELINKQGEKRNGEIIVIEASDSSENTHKRLSDKCKFYNVKHIRIRSTCEILGKAVGKGKTAAVAVADKNFRIAIENKLSAAET